MELNFTQQEAVDKINSIQKPKFNFGDQVTSIKTGLPGIGKIVGSMPTHLHVLMQGGCASRLIELFPNMFENHVYWVYFDEPRKNMSYNEYYDLYKDMWKEEAIQKGYEQLPVIQIINYQEDDLELFE